MEYDGSVLYFTPSTTSGRGVVPTETFIAMSGAKTILKQNTVQSIFSGVTGSTNGAVSLAASTTYAFTGNIGISAWSTSSTLSFSLAATGLTVTSIDFATTWTPAAVNSATVGTVVGNSFNALAGGLVLSTAAATGGRLLITGTIRVNGTGTVNPSITFGTSPTGTAPTFLSGSNFTFTPLGSNTVNTAGTWS
jgi:hypothetical protein